jgi:hypothetical protein
VRSRLVYLSDESTCILSAWVSFICYNGPRASLPLQRILIWFRRPATHEK